MINSAQLTPARRVMHRSYVVRLIARALERGGVRKSLTHVHWDASADCETAHIIEIEGRLNAIQGVRTRHADGTETWRMDRENFDRARGMGKHELPLLLVMEVQCRRCPPCLRRRAAAWRHRAEEEIRAAPRTWFGTLTLAPGEFAYYRMKCHARLSKVGVVFDGLIPRDQFRELHIEISKDITKWLKRVRKESAAKLRYCLVAEAHKSGLPHYHILIHEVIGGGSVKERTLRKQWALGFSKFNLVHDKVAARYVCKYLAKSSISRVRASIDYGKSP